MKRWIVLAVAAALLAGCGKKEVISLEALRGAEEEEIVQKLSGVSRDELAAAWGEPVQELFGMDGEIFLLDDDTELIVYYGKDGQTVETVRLEEINQVFEGVIKERYASSAVVEVENGSHDCSPGALVSVSLDEGTEQIQAGARVRVTYSGPVMESYPLQLQKQLRVELLSAGDDDGAAGGQPAEAESVHAAAQGENAGAPEIPEAGDYENASGGDEGEQTLGLSMAILEADKTGAKLELFNATEAEMIFGEDYGLERFADGKWTDVPYLIDNWAVEAIGYMLPQNSPVEWEVNWETFHGALDPGRYRILKSVTEIREDEDNISYRLEAEFVIE